MSRAADPRPTPARPPWAELRRELEALGFRPTKTLGQNFLVDPNAVRSIVHDAGLEAGARVLEVGAGCGFLTRELVAQGCEVLAVEIDARLLRLAQRLLAGQERVRWLHADALAGKHALAPELLAALPAHGPWHLVANLPYSISSPLLVLLSRLGNPPLRMTVLVQEEVAQRITAMPSDPEWGALGARLALRYRRRAGRAVGAQLFWPRPRVASRVAHLELEGAAPGEADQAAFDGLVEALFQQRRKQIGTTLAVHLGRERAGALLDAAGLDPRARPEVLGVQELLDLARRSGWAPRRP